MKILKAKQVGSNFNVVVEIDGEQSTLTRKKSSFKDPKELEKLKTMCEKLTNLKNPETKTAIKLANDIYAAMTPVSTEVKKEAEKVQEKIKATKKASKKADKNEKEVGMVLAKTNTSLKSLISEIKERIAKGEGTEEDIQNLQELMPKKAIELPAATSGKQYRGEH